MVTLAGNDAYFTLIDSGISQTQWESCIDQGIDLINSYIGDSVLPNMTGTAGAKSVVLTSEQAGWVRSVAVQVYVQDYKSAGATSSSYSISGLSSSQSVSSSSGSSGLGGNAHVIAQQAAKVLREVDADLG